MQESHRTVFLGLLFGMLILLSSEILASAMGLYEEEIEDWLKETALQHTALENGGLAAPGSDLKIVFKDSSSARRTGSKAWVYFQRAHAHGEGMGVIAIALSLLAAASLLKPLMKIILSAMIGVGAFVYPFCWFYAGYYMVSIGKSAARAEIDWLARTSVSLYLVGLILLLLLIICYHLRIAPVRKLFFSEE
ncbi:MAG: hypothetical protein D6719_13840 [Candidatus Dadabacteria bacterium]|nr:MAG: hypothetical protein D6719_13840 [Candidatus Dadabacteria bacterium]